MKIKSPYGLRNNELLTIDEVESGLDCNCVCPACKKQLIAKKGKINVNHFAHYKSEDCLGGLETALHKLSKNIISKSKTFATPIYYFENTKFEIFDEANIPIDNVKLEKAVGDIVPDIIIETKGKKLLIEIIVNNPISFEKLKKIKSKNLPTIAVYAKYLLEGIYSKKDFKLQSNLFQKELISGTKYKYWIHNPKINSIKRNLKDNYAEAKEVKHFENSFTGGEYFYVDNCPLNKRTWQSGLKKGKSFANLEYNCNSCKYCLSIEYQDLHNSNPHTVYCLGYLKNDFRQLLKQIKND